MTTLTADTEAAIQADVREVIADLKAIQARLLTLSHRAKALPGYEEADAVNRLSENIEKETLAYRLCWDLSWAADEYEGDREAISRVIEYLERTVSMSHDPATWRA